MKWYYEWKLKRVRAQIAALETEARARLFDDHTTHSKLRVLKRIADTLQQRVAKFQRYSELNTSEQARP